MFVWIIESGCSSSRHSSKTIVDMCQVIRYYYTVLLLSIVRVIETLIVQTILLLICTTCSILLFPYYDIFTLHLRINTRLLSIEPFCCSLVIKDRGVLSITLLFDMLIDSELSYSWLCNSSWYLWRLDMLLKSLGIVLSGNYYTVFIRSHTTSYNLCNLLLMLTILYSRAII
jgi:hypothetical protein